MHGFCAVNRNGVGSLGQVVDDERAVCIGHSLAGEQSPKFSCGQAALDEMVNHPPNLLITDWHMKPMDGYQLLKTIRRAEMMPLCLLPVVMLTGFASRQFVQKSFDAGVQQFLVKPISPNTLLERIK